jgi:hypothetical protein
MISVQRLIAQFLSPKVCFMHSTDASITEYMVEAKDFHEQFNLFPLLGHASAVRVQEASYSFYQWPWQF